MSLEFEWDDEKAASNLAKHGVSFPKAARVFRNLVLESVDDREDYGEVRYIGVGVVDTHVLTVVFTRVSESRIRLISAWRASAEDEKYYFSEVFSG